MATADSVKAKIQGLIDSANAKTGSTDGDLTAAVNGLLAGYGQGGGDDTTLFAEINNNTLTDFMATEAYVKLRPYAFHSRSALKTADLSRLKGEDLPNGRHDISAIIGGGCFENCTGLESIALPNILAEQGTETVVAGVTWLGGKAFCNCTSLKEFCTEYKCQTSTASISVFQGCTALEKAIIPNFTSNGFSGYFSGCINLEIVDFSPSQVSSNCFLNCAKLNTVIIRNTNMATLGNVNSFKGTPFASGGTGGTVYVPQALIEQYQQATNWSTLYAAGTCNFAAIEGSEYQ